MFMPFLSMRMAYASFLVAEGVAQDGGVSPVRLFVFAFRQPVEVYTPVVESLVGFQLQTGGP